MSAKLSLSPVAPGSGQDERCPVRDVLDCIGDRWSLLTLAALEGGTLRFTELKRAIGDISQRMLAQTLRTLERDGYVTRKVHPTVPPKVEYTLTDLGGSLLAKVKPLIRWADENHARVRKARKAYVPPATAMAL
ncbi:MAG: helix-turn-helix transcriptional regulator [Opitutaceae bacterium]|nr:helix-turn-helix transcriptional regulator [Opitutaceae bacterium]